MLLRTQVSFLHLYFHSREIQFHFKKSINPLHYQIIISLHQYITSLSKIHLYTKEYNFDLS